MNSLLKLLIPSALLLTLLTGCETSLQNNPRISLAAVPGDIRACFTRMTGAPMPGTMTQRQIVQLVTDLRRSERAKTQCGRRLLNIYDTQANAYGKDY